MCRALSHLKLKIIFQRMCGNITSCTPSELFVKLTVSRTIYVVIEVLIFSFNICQIKLDVINVF